jgi:acyl-CoA thioester hydrolase
MRGHADQFATNLPAPASEVPRAGATRLRVRYCECDPMNVAHHAAYVPWLEIGRTELLRSGGVAYAQLERAGVFLVIAKLEAAYRRPVLYDDVVEIRTRVASASRVKVVHAYEVVVVERGGEPTQIVAAVAGSTLACVDRDGRVQTLPTWLGGSE